MSQPDIIYYLAPEDIDDSLRGWHDLQQEYLATSQQGEGIKKWLERERGVRVGKRSVRAAAGSLDRVPEDLVSLLRVVEGLAALQRR